jgi:hypothetical protein
MFRGMVNARWEAMVPLRVRGPVGTELRVDAVADSGFTASLMLPAGMAAALGLARQSGSGVGFGRHPWSSPSRLFRKGMGPVDT